MAHGGAVAGVVIGCFVCLVGGILLCCFLCPSCPGAKCCKNKHNDDGVIVQTPVPISSTGTQQAAPVFQPQHSTLPNQSTNPVWMRHLLMCQVAKLCCTSVTSLFSTSLCAWIRDGEIVVHCNSLCKNNLTESNQRTTPVHDIV